MTTSPLSPSLPSAARAGAAGTVSLGRAAIAGLVAAAAALGVSELMAGLLPGATSLVAAIGQVVIDAQPPGAKDLVVALFGTNDKLALEVVIVLASLAIGAGLGVLATRRFAIAVVGFGVFGVAGFLAAIGDPLASPAIVAAQAALAVGVGIQVLGSLLSRARRTSALDSTSVSTGSDPARRSFLLRSGAIGIAAVAAGVGGRALVERLRSSPTGAGIPLPPATEPVPALASGTDLSPSIPGLTPIVMPNDRFYRIDTALLVPSVDTATWTLRIHGLVDRETTLTWEELLGLQMFEQYVTIACVSNEVGGNLVGNAKWTGVRLREVLELAGVQASATQLVGRSVDGWTAGMPTAWVMDPTREPMIAVQMNDEPLPVAHGYPARLIIPGLYGYVSATKWLAELELTTLESFDGYWVPLGWAKDAPILTQSRIDTPSGGVPAGRVAIAGIAWAPDRGISRVEVSIDDDWHDAELSAPISDTTWVQWKATWDAAPGDHVLRVRATDGEGVVQEELSSPPAPDGARGWHTRRVHVG
ncbi:MAG TPA: molybdopterin-dependent oxidoreductase [Candidatus Saccharimonadales bacterium]|nr:molybdopterin-dependent oxidoreductase [Candidatus Saccharimonadales bacterium]